MSHKSCREFSPGEQYTIVKRMTNRPRLAEPRPPRVMDCGLSGHDSGTLPAGFKDRDRHVDSLNEESSPTLAPMTAALSEGTQHGWREQP